MVLGFHLKSLFAFLSATSISTSFGRSRLLSNTTSFCSEFVSFFIRVSISSIFHVLRVPMLIISPSMLGVWRADIMASVVSST